MLENYDKAVEYYDKAIKLEKDNALAYYNKAEALDKSDRDKNRFLVEECLNKAIAFDSRYEEGLKTTAGTFYKDLSKILECAFGINSEDEFELEMLKRLNSFKEFENEKKNKKKRNKQIRLIIYTAVFLIFLKICMV